MSKYHIFHLQFFLAVANQGPRRDRPSKSVIYRWSKKRKRFGVFQELVTWTSRDVEYFQIENQHYLAVANHVQGKEYSVNRNNKEVFCTRMKFNGKREIIFPNDLYS